MNINTSRTYQITENTRANIVATLREARAVIERTNDKRAALVGRIDDLILELE